MIANRRGSTSILVILVIVVLATFGGVAVTSAWINKKLAMKTVSWREEYYEQDRQAEYMTARIDAVLRDARDRAAAYFTDAYFARGRIPAGIAPSLISAEFTQYVADLGASSAPTAGVRELYTRLYFYYAAANLADLAKTWDIKVTAAGGDAGAFLDVGLDAPGPGDLTAAFTVSAGEDPGDLYLNVSLVVEEPAFELRIANGGDWRYGIAFRWLESGSRYRVTCWSAGQVPMEMTGESDSFDGSVGG